MLSVTMSPFPECHYAECRYAECHSPFPECHYTECRSAECRGTKIRYFIFQIYSLSP